MSSSIVKLNAEQQQAADHFEGACLVTAVPGAGKTAALTQRVVKLMARGVPARNICCITFTNKAAAEMKERVVALDPDAQGVWVSTFHKLCLTILRKYGSHVGLPKDFSIYADDEKNGTLNKANRMVAAASGQAEAKMSSQERGGLAGRIDDLRESAQPFDLSTEDSRLAVYIDELRHANAVDFSGMLYLTWNILKKNPDIAKRVSDRFRFVLIDEAQDTNNIQYAIAKIIAVHGNLFMVSDYNQSIFSWRGAKPENLLKFKRDFPGALELTLPRNYRSRAEILESAENIIRKNADARNVVLVPERGVGGTVKVAKYETNWAEARAVASKITKCAKNGNYGDVAIIYRLNKLAQALEVELSGKGIPYKTRGGKSFFNRKEIKTTLAYMKLLVNPDDSEAFKVAITTPKRGVGDVLVGKIENLARGEGITLAEAAAKIQTRGAKARILLDEFLNLLDAQRASLLQGKSIQSVSEKLTTASGYAALLKKEADEEKDPTSSVRLENVETFLAGIGEFEANRKNPTLGGFLQQISLVQDGDKSKEENVVNLMTMHAAKGLEFPFVFIIGCDSGTVPFCKAVEEGREEEERRLMYVAATRAKDYLHISYHENKMFRGRSIELNYSPYLKDMFDREEVV